MRNSTADLVPPIDFASSYRKQFCRLTQQPKCLKTRGMWVEPLSKTSCSYFFYFSLLSSVLHSHLPALLFDGIKTPIMCQRNVQFNIFPRLLIKSTISGRFSDSAYLFCGFVVKYLKLVLIKTFIPT